jgi:hypothetical protein
MKYALNRSGFNVTLPATSDRDNVLPVGSCTENSCSLQKVVILLSYKIMLLTIILTQILSIVAIVAVAFKKYLVWISGELI